ncbi:MAG TPA: hypothetical protein EYP28_07060 [Methanophagales archaeon]|nr:hypothetical protein [Methanophagales archaeon]
MKKQNKNKEGEEAEQAQVTVYHIAIPHQEELWREWMPEIEKFMPKVRILFLEFTTLLDKGERERIEKHFNFLSQGKVLPYFHSEDFLKSTLSWTTVEEFLYNTRKKIFLENMPGIAGVIYDRHNEALREKVDLFFERRFKEAGKKYQEAMELQMKEIKIRDEAIGRQLDEIIETEKGNILLLLGEDHSPSSKKAKIVRWESKEYTNLAREISDSVRDLNEKELEELLFRRIGMFWVEGYWEKSGEAGIKAIERAIKILNSVPIPRLKEMYDFIVEGKREDAFFRAILWLKREGFITDEWL